MKSFGKFNFSDESEEKTQNDESNKIEEKQDSSE